MPTPASLLNATLAVFAVAALAACSDGGTTDFGGTGGTASGGVAASGGMPSGGASGGMPSGGATGGVGGSTGGVGGATGGIGGGTGGVGGGTGGVGGGTGGVGGSMGYPATIESLEWAITNLGCSASCCHGGFEQRLDLTVGPDLASHLTGWTSDICGMPVVDPGNPDNSALIKLMKGPCGEYSVDCTLQAGDEPFVKCLPQMFPGCQPGFDCVPDDRVEAIAQWITDGALP